MPADALRALAAAGMDRFDADLAPHLAGLPNLEVLLLQGAQLTDAGLEPLAKLKTLRQLDLRGNKLSDDAVAKLQAALPAATILR